MVDDLMNSFGITASAVGLLTSFYIYSYAPMQVPVGILMDHFGVKKVLSLASIVCGLGAIVFALSKYLAFASLGRLLIGAGSSFAFIAMIYVSSNWFDQTKRALLIGVGNSLAMLGASAGNGPLAVFIKNFGWRNSISAFGVFGIILGVIIFFVFKLDKQDEKIEKKTARVKSHIFENIMLIMSKKSTWINAIAALLFYMTTTIFAGLWGASFVQKAYLVSKEVAGYAMSMVFAGWLVGGPLMGFFSDLLGKRKVTIRIGVVGALLCLVPVIYFPFIHIYLVYALLFLVGLFSSAELLSFSLAIELNTFKAKATAAAFTNFIISLGDAIFQPLVGFLLDSNWNGSMLEGIRVYRVEDYQIALSCLPITLVLAFILIFFVKEKAFKKVSVK
ncbi:MAG: putative sulfoacetate transporter SauU [Candidatus Anoxychlamydiales bacterium]|nr:putative sulfoacetate transporter SauU [Candidatus Anoxychlamydiales bacterium]NGX52580.1 putative sulfoacetate transporter SauU [Candidatus Anoxychlamydiales bacterium]